MTERLRLFMIINLSTLLEDPDFKELFCKECSRRGCYLDSPDEAECPRRRYWQDIEETLDNATHEVVERCLSART